MEQRSGDTAHFKNSRWELALSGAECCRRGEKLCFLLPYSPHKPFPLPELMCFARLEEREGTDHIMYAFNSRKEPTF